MATAANCRSPLHIAEDYLITAAKHVFNVSPAEAAHYRIQIREIGGAIRAEAEQLLLNWEGTEVHQAEAYRLYNLKVSAIFRFFRVVSTV